MTLTRDAHFLKILFSKNSVHYTEQQNFCFYLKPLHSHYVETSGQRNWHQESLNGTNFIISINGDTWIHKT